MQERSSPRTKPSTPSQIPLGERFAAAAHLHLPTFIAWSHALDRFLDARVEQIPWIVRTPHARMQASSILISVFLPILIVACVPEFASDLRPFARGILLLLAPLWATVSILYPWAMGDKGLIRGVLSSMTVYFPYSLIGSKHPLGGVPWVTLTLIGVNVLAFYGTEGDWMHLSYRTPYPGNFVLSLFAHANTSHLYGNMLYLWVFGSALEPRIGRLRYLALYIGLGAILDIPQVISFQLECGNFGGSCGRYSGSLGASGAISVVMGLYMVRLYWTRIATHQSMPALLGIPVGVRLPLPAPFFLTLFCVSELSAVSRDLYDGIGHNVHLYGYYAGLIAGYSLGLFRDGMREYYLKRGTETKRDDDFHSRWESLDQVLDFDHDNIEALLGKARHKRQLSPRVASELYRQAIGSLLESGERRRAAEVFAEYFTLTWEPIDASRQLAITSHLAALGERRIAAEALERTVQDPGVRASHRAQGLAYLGKLLVELGLPEAAEHSFSRLLSEFPEHPSCDIARSYLEKLHTLDL